jgi:opacity protein-like surface antigen
MDRTLHGIDTSPVSESSGHRRRGGRRRASLALAFAAIAVVALAGTTAAAATQPVRIVSHMTFPGDGPNYGDFAVEGGGDLICAGGDVQDTRYVFGGFQSDLKVQILVLKDFVCGDGSGIIHVKIQVHSVMGVGETFTWVVMGGTGPYAHLSGSGGGETIPNADPTTGNTNIYTGFLVG